jgi:putative ABC transport system permease protein
VAAIVTGVGWTLAFSSLVTSLQHSWLGWLDQSFQSDLVVSAGTASVSLLTYPPVREEIADDLRTMPGVQEVQAIRSVEGDYLGRPIVLMAIDPATQGLPLVDGVWTEVAPTFWQGGGIVISENLAHKTGLRKGEVVTLPTPSGARPVRILGTFADFQNGGDLGCVALCRETFRLWWGDHLVTRMRVWLMPGADLMTVRRTIEARWGHTYGLHALTFAEARAGVAELVRSCFSISYAMVLIAMAVSLAGIVNFLLAAVLDRSAELQTLSALGVTTRQLIWVLVSEGGLIGTVGACIGVLAGIAVSRIIVLHSVPMVNGWHFAWRFSPVPALVLVGAVTLLACLAGVLPARLVTRRPDWVEAREP